jgi:hypothetical protein
MLHPLSLKRREFGYLVILNLFLKEALLHNNVFLFEKQPIIYFSLLKLQIVMGSVKSVTNYLLSGAIYCSLLSLWSLLVTLQLAFVINMYSESSSSHPDHYVKVMREHDCFKSVSQNLEEREIAKTSAIEYIHCTRQLQKSELKVIIKE